MRLCGASGLAAQCAGRIGEVFPRFEKIKILLIAMDESPDLIIIIFISQYSRILIWLDFIFTH